MSKVRPSLPLFLFLFSLYLLTYSPTLHSSDGLAMFSTAESLVRRGAWDIEQIRWMGLQQGTYGLDGLLYSRKGAGQPLLALPLTWLGLVIPLFGTVTATMLFGSFITALSGTLIFIYLNRLGYAKKTGLIAGLVYGTGTMAWPYAKTFFSDTLAGLLLLVAALALLTFRQSRQNRYAFIAGLSLAWAVATRYAEAVFLPVFGLLFLAYLLQDKETRRQGDKGKFILSLSPCPLVSLSFFVAPILVVGLSLLAFNTLRYGNPLNTGYLPQETFSAVWWRGILGQLVSPGRGLLLYSPVLLVSFLGLKAFWQQRRLELLASLAVILVHLLLYGKWFMWHGGFAWGPRFMIATLPFWVILMAPVIERLYSTQSPSLEGGARGGSLSRSKIQALSGQQSAFHPPDCCPARTNLDPLRRLFSLLWGVSVFLQIPGLAVDFDRWQNRLLGTGLPLFDPITFFNPAYSPLLGTWQFISPANLDVAWVVEGKIIWPLLAVLALNALVAGWALKQLFTSSLPFPLEGAKVGEKLKSQAGALIPLTLAALTAILLVAAAHHSQPAGLSRAAVEVNRLPNVPLIYRDPQTAIPLAELYRGRAAVLGLGEPEWERLDGFTAPAASIWWLPGYPDEVESYLKANYGLAREEKFGRQRLLLFARPDGEAQAQAVAFGDQISLQSRQLSRTLQPNRPLAVELVWQAKRAPRNDYHVFIHLLDAGGQKIAQSDGQPAGWTRPTTAWQPGETIVDRHALWVDGLAPGRYTLIAGLYSPANGERLLTEDGNSYVKLGTFEVSSRESP